MNGIGKNAMPASKVLIPIRHAVLGAKGSIDSEIGLLEFIFLQ
jgi:hypothetical protein